MKKLIFLGVLFFCFSASANVSHDPDFSQVLSDTLSSDSSDTSEISEFEFQNNLDTLFDSDIYSIDTTKWNTCRINAEHLDYLSWNDSAIIPLIDSTQNKTYVHPFKNNITSDFGMRHYMWHYGVDIKLNKGDSVRAAFDGIIRVIQYDKYGYGNVVVIRHANGLETIYGHLSKDFVAVNQRVAAGEIIGLGGNTGRSTGSHLHLEMRYHGEPFNPHCIIDFEKGTLKSPTLVLTRADFLYLEESRKALWHTVRRGDSIGRIARTYHTSIRKICMLNHITKKTILRVGRKVLITPDRRATATAMSARASNLGS